MTPPPVCITGAGGFVGSALAAGLAALGWPVTGVDLAFDEATRARLAGVTLITADLSCGTPAGMPAAGVLIHAAAVTTPDETRAGAPASLVDANLRPLLRVLDHAARCRPDVFVFVSSSGVFDACDGAGALCDTHVPSARTPYAAAKRAGELLVPAALAGMAATHVVRLGHIYGPHESPRPTRTRVSAVARWLADARAGRPLVVTADNPRREWTCSTDLAPALARLLAAPAVDRPVHLCSPFVLGDRDLARLVAACVPGAVIHDVPPAGPTKPPMRASPLACLADMPWTAPADGVARLAAMEAAA